MKADMENGDQHYIHFVAILLADVSGVVLRTKELFTLTLENCT